MATAKPAASTNSVSISSVFIDDNGIVVLVGWCQLKPNPC